MSLMLNALKQIKARQSCPIVSVAAGLPDPAISPSSATVVESAEPQPQLSPAPPHVPLDDFMLPDSFSLEATIDQLQAFVSEAGLLDDSKSAADHETSDAAALADAGCDDTEPLVVMPIATDPHAATAQRILQQLPRGRSHALLFTSPSDGQGKTMTVARLAPRLAQGIEGELLVMDANFRNPDMARWLAAAPAWRLPDVLAGAVDWATAVQVTAHRRVSFLAGGTGVPSHGLSSNIQGAPVAPRIGQPLRAGGHRLPIAGAPRDGPTGGRLRRRLPRRAVGRWQSADASRGGPDNQFRRRPPAGMRGHRCRDVKSGELQSPAGRPSVERNSFRLPEKDKATELIPFYEGNFAVLLDLKRSLDAVPSRLLHSLWRLNSN